MLRQETVSESEVRLVLSGSLFGEAGLEFEKKLTALLDTTFGTITLDFSTAIGITSPAIGRILAVHKLLSEQKRTIRIAGCSEVLFILFQKIKLDTVIPISRASSRTGQ